MLNVTIEIVSLITVLTFLAGIVKYLINFSNKFRVLEEKLKILEELNSPRKIIDIEYKVRSLEMLLQTKVDITNFELLKKDIDYLRKEFEILNRNIDLILKKID